MQIHLNRFLAANEKKKGKEIAVFPCYKNMLCIIVFTFSNILLRLALFRKCFWK